MQKLHYPRTDLSHFFMTHIQADHSVCSLGLVGIKTIPIIRISLAGVIRIGRQYESGKIGIVGEQNWLKWLRMVYFECPRHSMA